MTTLKTLSALAIAAAALSVTLATSNVASASPNRLFGQGHRPVAFGQTHKVSPIIQKYLGGRVFTCLACNLPRPKPTHPHPQPWRFHHWNYGWYHGYGWRRPAVVVAGAPAAVVAGPAQATPAAAPASAGPCNCLTKQNLPNGAVLFQDICTKQSAIASPEEAAAR